VRLNRAADEFYRDVAPKERTVQITTSSATGVDFTLTAGPSPASNGTRGPAQPPPKLAPVEVRVNVDYGGEFGSGPLAGATVVIMGAGKTAAQGVTNRDGVFRANLAPGADYMLRVSKLSNQQLTTATRSFNLGQSYSTSVTLQRAR
jgi:hypothetical protein